MKHPFWLINSCLLILFCVCIWFVFFFNPVVPRRISFDLDGAAVAAPRKILAAESIEQIYQNDLFGTYKAPARTKTESANEIPARPIRKPIPNAPAPQPVKVVPPQPPRFLDPLQITLRGIITTKNEAENSVIIQDPRSPQLRTCAIGDMIEDAQIIRIVQNKVTVVRSNGQQESLYINQHEAELDQRLRQTSDWKTVIRNDEENKYTVFSSEFIQKILTVGQLIEMLQLGTVFQKGTPIGCRIGKDAIQPFITALGLKSGDIVTAINQMPIGTMIERSKLYQEICLASYPLKLSINLQRQGKNVTILYEVQSEMKSEPGHQAAPPTQLGTTRVLGVPTPEVLEEQKLRFIEEKHQFSPTIEKLKKRDTISMMSGGNRRPIDIRSSSPISPLAIGRG